MKHWSGAEWARYQKLIGLQTLKGCKWLAVLACTLFPAFGFLDYYSHAENFSALMSIRITVSLLCLAFGVFIWTRKSHAHALPYGIALVLLCDLGVSLLCLENGNFASPYYAGINLVILASTLVMPVGLRKTVALTTVVILVYISTILIKTGLPIDEMKHLVNNLYFLLSTFFICSVASYVAEAMRQNAFNQYLQIEKAQQDIQRSRDLLQAELHSEQNNVETLIREITIRKAELEKALSLRDEFISLASHELNTPLSALKLQTMLAQRKFASAETLAPAEIDKIIQTYELQLQRLIRIVGDMLDISRISQGRLDLEYGHVDLNETVSRVVELLSPKGSGEIRVREEGPITGHWDSFKIEQVILNLLTNAIKYGEKRPVEIRLFKTEGKAVIEVQDQGIGISPEYQKRIFERFERAVQPREFSGLGLGLYIARQIILAHAGEIGLVSEVSKGSTFRVELPLFQTV